MNEGGQVRVSVGQPLVPALYVVATPIGNLDDISLRAVKVLSAVDAIAAEDTRHSQRLLQHLGIVRPLISLHEHNEAERVRQLLDKIEAGQSIALISDAGTPLISDPGYVVVRALRSAGIRVVPVPGACAAIAALSVSGLPTDRFTFEGFLPAKAGARAEMLKRLVDEARTLVFYESPHRLVDMLEAVIAVMGDDREVVVARELTKAFETIYSGAAQSVLEQICEDSFGERGEFVVLVRGAPPRGDAVPTLDPQHLARMLVDAMPVKAAARVLAEVTGQSKNYWYEALLVLKDVGGAR